MKKRISLFLLLLIVAFTFNMKDVMAAYMHATYEDWSGGHIKKLADGHEGDTYVYKMHIDTDTPAFCVDYGATISAGEAQAVDFLNYLKGTLSDSTAKDVLNKINGYLYYGYGSSGRNTEKYYLATQKLVWEALSKSGFYGSNSFTTLNFKFEGGSNIDVSSEASAIEKSISDHYAKPSICDTSSISLKPGESKTLTDSKGLLSKYQLTCTDKLTCNVNGNSVVVTASSNATGQKVTLTKSGAGSNAVLYKNIASPTSQQMVTGGSVGPVTCNISVTIDEVKTTVNISKQDATTGDELPGAELVLKDSNGKVVAEWTSTNEPHKVSNLTPGKYTLTETIAPKGYQKSTETVTFTVKADGTVDGNVVMMNKPEDVIVNPPTGLTIVVAVAWLVGVAAIIYSIYYFVTMRKKEN